MLRVGIVVPLLPARSCGGLLDHFSQHQFPLQRHVSLFYKRDRNKVVGRCADVIERPIVVVARQHLADALGAVDLREGAVFPVKKFDPVVQLLFESVDGDLDFNILFAGKVGDWDSDVSHSFGKP